jgi:DNA-3-methyladenine glycosylase II
LESRNFKEVEKSLIKIRGIGPWTANYVLMRCLRFPTAFPIDDVGLINAIKTLLNMDRKPTKDEILALSIPWANWESYATFYLWRVLY